MTVQAVSSPPAEQLFLEAMLTPPDADTYGAYRRLREAAPALLTADGTLVLSGFDGCSAALRHRALGKGDELLGMQFSNVADDVRALISTTIGASMLFANPPEHTRLRRLVSDQFTPRHVEELTGIVTRRTDLLLDRLADAGTADFVRAFALVLPLEVIADLLGVPQEDRDGFLPLVHGLAKFTDPDVAPDELAEFAGTARQLVDYFVGLLARKRREPGDDLLTRLVTHDALTEAEMVSTSLLLFGAGFETTTNLLGSGLAALLDDPALMRALRDDPGLVPGAVEEFLRYDAPIQIDARTVLDPVTLHGVDLLPGQTVITLLAAANHDPGHFVDPGTYDFTRAPNDHLAFAAGTHFCLGAHLTRLEARIAFTRLLDRFPEIALAGEPVRRSGLALRGWAKLPVAVG
ncbi:cytochrome P450 [Actinocorallia sp. A-T 12471]|uniref:cytochrome P450 n=1 Tax=Actinocorallia sp. A-T 12471 TaxID=3089813 RepID=UPI0029CE33AF|nr:cytochrome P450 [Actinocorallia sp. A-T 12471]MDX6740119.1 cytochrome P450 [Actinocorallia sp. A-T 12471]